jgi:hypothetical protein
VTSRYPKRPQAPPHTLIREEDDLVAVKAPVWRVHRTTGSHVLGWNRLRAWGPAANCLWEPHPLPAGDYPGDGVLYTAADLATAVLETFQDSRLIDPHTGRPRATSWTPARPLRLLNLADDWCLRNGASAALTSGPQTTCRTWARAIRHTWPDLDGLWTASVFTGRPNIVLWAPAADTFPTRPAFSQYLFDDLLWDRLDHLAARYRQAGYRII